MKIKQEREQEIFEFVLNVFKDMFKSQDVLTITDVLKMAKKDIGLKGNIEYAVIGYFIGSMKERTDNMMRNDDNKQEKREGNGE